MQAPTTARRAGCWATTTVTALVFLMGGPAYLLRADTPLQGMAALGYPVYFVTLVGTWKVSAGSPSWRHGFPV